MASKNKILVTGANGQLGSYVLRAFSSRDAQVVAWSGRSAGQLFGYGIQPVDLHSTSDIVNAYQAAKPATIIHAAAMSRVDECYADPGRARTINCGATQLLVELAAKDLIPFIYVSTDLVFDGQQGWYVEHDPVAPLSVYGRTKADAEIAVRDYEKGTILRASLLYGPTLQGASSFFEQQCTALRAGQPCRLFCRRMAHTAGCHTAAESLATIGQAPLSGTFHLGGPERMSRLELGQRLARFLRCDPSHIQAIKRADVQMPEPRPADVSLDSNLLRRTIPQLAWPNFEESLTEMMAS